MTTSTKTIRLMTEATMPNAPTSADKSAHSGQRPEHSRRRWTEAEDRRLANAWSCGQPERVAEALGRTREAVVRRAVLLGLDHPDRGTLSGLQAEQYTGWSRKSLLRAARALGIVVPRKRAVETHHRGAQRKTARVNGNHFAFTLEMLDRLSAWCAEHGGRREGFAWSNILGPDGARPACERCGRSGVRHTGQGLCTACYHAVKYADRKLDGVPVQWTGRSCLYCRGVWDVPPQRRTGAPPLYCDDCRAARKGGDHRINRPRTPTRRPEQQQREAA